MIEDRYLSNNKDEKRYKIIIVGDSCVGKTALFWKFTQGEFLAEKETQVTTIDFKIKNVTLRDRPAKLYIWDTAGQERYRSIVSTYFKGCHGVMMVFDLSREGTFKNIQDQWYEICLAKAEKAVIVLIGNKSDQDHRVSDAEVKQWAKKHNIKYVETSVKAGKNVDEAFMTLARGISDAEMAIPRTESFALNGKKSKKAEKKKCC